VLAGGVDPVFPKLGKVKLHGSAPKITSYGLPCLKSNWVGLMGAGTGGAGWASAHPGNFSRGLTWTA